MYVSQALFTMVYGGYKGVGIQSMGTWAETKHECTITESLLCFRLNKEILLKIGTQCCITALKMTSLVLKKIIKNTAKTQKYQQAHYSNLYIEERFNSTAYL